MCTYRLRVHLYLVRRASRIYSNRFVLPMEISNDLNVNSEQLNTDTVMAHNFFFILDTID